MNNNNTHGFAGSGGSLGRLAFVAICAVACGAATAQARISRDSGGTIDLGPFHSHVDIPEIAGVPGGPGSWPPSILPPLDPLIDPDPTRVVMPEPIPIPSELPRVEDAPFVGSGPKPMIPAVIMPPGVGLDGSDGGAMGVSPGAVPAPGAGVLVGLALIAVGGRRRR